MADVLTWPGNRHYVTAIKAARDFSIPPTVLIIQNKQPSDGWSSMDKKLAIAFQILEDETCGDCGVPVWIGHSDDENVVFEISSRTCYSCGELEKKREEMEKAESRRKGNSRKQRGKKTFLTQRNPDKHPSREDFYREEVERTVT